MRREDLTHTQKMVATCAAALLMIVGVMLFPGSEEEAPQKPKRPRTTPILEVKGDDALDAHRNAVRRARALADESTRRTEEWQSAFDQDDQDDQDD